MKLNFLTKKLLFLNLMFILFLGAGCNKLSLDLEKTKEFGEVSKQYEENYRAIVTDIYASCIRVNKFRTPVLDREKFDNECLDQGKRQEDLLLYHQFLAEYSAALRKLSSDEIINLTGPGRVAESILSLPIPSPGFQQASNILQPIAGRIVNAIASAVADRYRTEVLEETIKGINTDIQIFISQLAFLTDQVYRINLNREAKEMATYYRQVLSQNQDPTHPNPQNLHPNSSQITAYLIDKQWRQDEEAAKINEKLDKLNTYLNTLSNMAKKHQELYDSLRENRPSSRCIRTERVTGIITQCTEKAN